MTIPKTITSRDNVVVKRFAALSRSAPARKRDGKCLLEGEHLAQSYVEHVGRLEILAIRDNGDAISPSQARLAAGANEVVRVAAPIFDGLSTLNSPSGVLAIAATPPTVELATSGCVLALDEVQDPGNVGTLIRSAAAAGVAQVWLSSGCAFAWSVKTLRAAQGAHFHLSVIEQVDLPGALQAFRGERWAMLPRSLRGVQTVSLYGATASPDTALVLSNEGHGLSEAIYGVLTRGLSIPMMRGIESLNVATAGAIAMFELLRQRSQQAQSA
ncbi:MAG: RNA methyltransferase [Burkholderiales bacterium]|nr:RNA methyltransferase [Burkholderiales bacterium]